MAQYVKIYHIRHGEQVVTRANALNRLKHNHVANGGSYCAINEADFYLTPEPEPVLEDAAEPYVPELPSANAHDIGVMRAKNPGNAAPPPPPSEDVEPITMEEIGVKPAQRAKKTATKKTRSKSSKK